MIDGIRVAAASVLLGFGLLAVFRIPHGILWKPAVAAIEWGHWLGLVALAVSLVGTTTRAGQFASLTAAIAAFLLFSPVLRAWQAGPAAETAFTAAFGPGPRPDRPAFSFAGLVASTPRQAPEERRVEGPPYRALVWRSATPNAPILVAIHGGSWNSGEPEQLADGYAWLASRGYNVVAVSYRFAPEHTFPDQLADLRGAIAWVHGLAAEIGADSDRIVLYGRSAGGHLALLAGHDHPDPAVRGVIAWYPPTDMTWSWNHPSNPLILDSPKTLGDFLGGPLAGREAVYAAASPIEAVRPGNPPTLLIHGGRDELVWPEQSRRMADRLREAGVPVLALELPWATHGADANLAGPSGQIGFWAIEAFLQVVAPAPAATPASR